MAYQKRTKSSSRKRTTGYTKRASTARRGSTSRKQASGRTVNTIRIVVEQPQAVSSVLPVNTTAPRKATF